MAKMIVIGGGPAGVTAALRARELGADVTLVERGRMGGTCTNDGCAPTRVLAKAARLLRDSQQFEDYGLQAVSPDLDFSRLMERTQQVIYQMQEKKQLIHRLEDAGVKVITNAGTARFEDAHTISLADGRRLSADQFILCAGGRARRLDFPGADLAFTHSDVWSLKNLPRSVVVVGAAATGCQLASIFRAFGTDVTLLEVAPRILVQEDEAVSQTVLDGFHRHGIKVVTGINGIDRLEKLESGLNLTYRKDDQVVSLPAEAVLLSTGWLGNLDSLNLPAAGVETNGRYVLVDDSLQTSAGHIFAAGDITGRMMLVQSAGYEAIIAAENAILGPERREKHTIVPHGGFTDPEYASVGLTEALAKAKEDVVSAVIPFADLDRAVIDGHTPGLCKLVVSRETHRVLGAHVVGEDALEIVHLVAAGMAADMWVEQLAELQIAYPTFTAAVGLAARRAVEMLGVRPLAREWRELERPYAAEWERRSP
jgi:pyruvate/2-oxoglutarate dehydrogenase complex dihydrolipoamide dehydrogenase (E3) component